MTLSKHKNFHSIIMIYTSLGKRYWLLCGEESAYDFWL